MHLRAYTSFPMLACWFFFSSRRRHTRFDCDWSSDVCSSDLVAAANLSISRLSDDDKKPRKTAAAPPRPQGDRPSFGVLVATTAPDISRKVDQWAVAHGHLSLAARSPDQALGLARTHLPEVLAVDVLIRDGA